MPLRIYNTLTRKKEIFKPLKPGEVTMYVCGPTVYDSAHVGHAMSAMVFDIIRRYLEYLGYKVLHAMNFTDVDDKIIARAANQGRDPFELAQDYIQEYERHLQDLNVLPASINPRATQEIEQIIQMVEALVQKEFAYPAHGDVYFRVDRFADYGKLSGRKLEDMQAGARIEVDDRKENPMDFALWKAAKPGEPYWDSPWGHGRPGWHIECSAMNLSHLGEQIDIHGGGNDLIFPHHENEIAQTECVTGKFFARFWVHNGMLQLRGEKMSKSLGNLITIEEFLKDHDASVFRLIILGSSYRGPLTFGSHVIEQGVRSLDRLVSALRPPLPAGAQTPPGLDETMQQAAQAAQARFIEVMDDDFNTAGALAVLFDLVRIINQARDQGALGSVLEIGQARLVELAGVLGLVLEREEKRDGQAAEPFIDLLLEVRAEMRKNKLWALSDLIRDRLKELGVTVEDSKTGAIWHWD